MALEKAELTQYLIPGTDAAFYIPEFVTPEEEEFLLRKACLPVFSVMIIFS